jgi:hypothetical protein
MMVSGTTGERISVGHQRPIESGAGRPPDDPALDQRGRRHLRSGAGTRIWRRRSPPHRRAGQPLPAHRQSAEDVVRRTRCSAGSASSPAPASSAASAWTPQLAPLRHLRDRRGARHNLPPALQAFLARCRSERYVIGGAMTDVKGDRSKAPAPAGRPRPVRPRQRRTTTASYIRGAKAHQTGCINSHWLIVMPTMRLAPTAITPSSAPCRRRAGHHLHLRPPVLRHAQHGGRRSRRRQRPLRRPGSAW